MRWGLLSTAAIGALVVDACRLSEGTQFAAVASRDAAKAQRFAEEHALPRHFGSYEDMLASAEIDAVYVALPISMHTQWTVAALQAGKHVLCEKPFATSAADAGRAFDAAEAAGRLCVEGLMWRHHPQTELARRAVADGAIGRLLLVRTALSVEVPAGDIRRTRSLGGGAYLDLGCYCVSATRLFAGEPERLFAAAVHAADGVDLAMAATMRLPDGVLGQLDIGLVHPRRDELQLVGSEGVLTVPDPWIGRSRALELRRGGRTESLPVPAALAAALGEDEDAVYRLELDRVSEAIRSGGRPEFGRADALAQARVLEALDASARSGAVVELGPVKPGTAWAT